MACRIQFISEDWKSQNLLVNMSRGTKLSHGVATRSERLYSKAKLSLWLVSPEQVCYKQLNQETDRQMLGSCLGSRNRVLLDGRKLQLPVVFQIYHSTPGRTGEQQYLFPRPCRFSQPNSKLQLQVTKSLKLWLLCSLSLKKKKNPGNICKWKLT